MPRPSMKNPNKLRFQPLGLINRPNMREPNYQTIPKGMGPDINQEI